MITLKDKLSHLSYNQACKLLGPEGKQLILEGGKYDINIFEQLSFNNEHFHLNLEDAQVSIQLDSRKKKRLNISCSVCPGACEHQGAALSLILEEKLTLGLSAPPPERTPMESLSDEALVRKEKIAAAGGKLVGAAFAFIGEMFSTREESQEMNRLAGAFKAKLSDCMEKADDGTLKMTISLPDESFLDNMARSLAKMVSAGRSES